MASSEAASSFCGNWCGLGAYVTEIAVSLVRGNFTWQELFPPISWGQWIASTFFSGRPKLGPDSASDNAAVSALGAVNPIVRAYGAGLRLLEYQGVPISASSGPGRAALDNLTAQFHSDVVYQFGPQTGASYFNSAIAYLFSHNCTNAPCTSVFQHDPTFRSWVSQGKIRPGDGFPLWRQPGAPPPAPPAPPTPPSTPRSTPPPGPPPPPAPPAAPVKSSGPPIAKTITVCGHRINLVGSAVEQTQQTRNAQLMYCPTHIVTIRGSSSPPPPAPPPPCPCAGPMPAPK